MKSVISVISTLQLTIGLAAQAAQPLVGEAAPDFELRDQDGELHSIEDYRGQWVVLYFYPKDGTPGCTTEACEFRDHIFAFREANCQVLGVSLDDQASHKAFAEEHALPFPLLVDSEGRAADAYGVKTRFLGMTMAERQTFLIDPHGRIAKHYDDVDPELHSMEILADLGRLQGGSLESE